MICEPGDVALVGFPFSDIQLVKVRPVVCLSIAQHNDVGETLVAMITTAKEFGVAGRYFHPSLVRRGSGIAERHPLEDHVGHERTHRLAAWRPERR